MQPHIFILYDSIKNSIFVSQVLTPFISQLERNEHEFVYIVSFEPSSIDSVFLDHLPTHPRLAIKIIPRPRFWARVGLWLLSRKLRAALNDFSTYTITARGPLAGYIALNAINLYCKKLTIQARGLAAQEYHYTHRISTGIRAWATALRFWQYESLERSVYGIRNSRTEIEAVSAALKEYLISHYHANQYHTTIAACDIPQAIPGHIKTALRTTIRTQLGIDNATQVYCYNGSALPWQCPEKTIEYFCEQYAKNSNSFLLILTRDSDQFKKHIHAASLSSDCYHVYSVDHTDIYRYLAACDVGILLREPHILNWVSRPTKLLEYQAVGLEIAHNNTIGCLVEKN